ALKDSADAAARALKKAQDRVAQTPKPRPVGDLSRMLTAADKLGDIADDIARRTRALERKTTAVNETIVGLGLPLELPGTAGARLAEAAETGRVAMLRELAIPPEKSEARYADWFAGLDKQIRDAHHALERLNAELAENAERIVAVKTAGDIATEDDLKAARRAR